MTYDLLQTCDGQRVLTADDWYGTRRPELRRLLGSEIFGPTPLGRPSELRFIVREEHPEARGGLATRLRIGILFEGTPEGRQMELLVYLPNAAKHPVPLFLGLNFNGNFTTSTDPDLPLPTHFTKVSNAEFPDHRANEKLRGAHAHRWPDEAIKRGYGIATACYGEIEPDIPNQWWHGPRVLAPPQGERGWGSIGAWAWALSRALDYLETLPRVDAKRVAVLGFSRLGKTALWAGAQDERFAAVISQNSGKAGASLMKRPVGEPVSHLSGDELGHWFAPRFRHYANNETSLPVDGDALGALIAPRPLLVLSASEDTWSNPEGEFLGARSATRVYHLLGQEGLKATEWPAPGTFINSRVGYFLRAGKHDVTPQDWKVTLEWADRFL